MFIQLNVLRQRDISRCEGFLPFNGLTGTLKTRMKSVSEMSENLPILTRLYARKYVIEFATVEASGLVTIFNFNQEVIFVAEQLEE
jgi:hypothetical protein